MKPKILVTTTTFPRWKNDPEPRFVLDLSKELENFFDVTVLAPADPGANDEEKLEGVKVIRFRYAPLRSHEVLAYPGGISSRLEKHRKYWMLAPLLVLGLYRRMRRMLATTEFSCVHAHWAIPQGFVQGVFFSKRNDPPYIVTCHGGDVYSYRGAFKQRLLYSALKHAKAVTVVSKAIQDTITKELKFEIEPRNLHVVPMGVDLGRFKPEYRDENFPAQYGLNRPVILFVGRFAEKKGLIYLLRAMATKQLRNTPASLAIIGDGPLRDELETEAANLEILQRVCFLGSFDHNHLPVAYASADIFCAPFIVAKSGDREGLPVVLNEASASGIPSVTTDVGGVREVISNDKTGFIVPQKDPNALANALNELIKDGKKRRIFGENALQSADKFSGKIIGEKYAKIISNAIETRSIRKSYPS